MIYINKQKNFKVYFGGCQHAILEADNGIGYDCFGSENHSHIGDDIKALAKFFWKAEASYLDNDNNLRVMWLSYDASKVALFNGHRLIDRNGNLYEYNDVFDVEINGKTTVGQLPYGKYMIDFEQTIEMIETGDLIDDEDNVKDEEEHTETPPAVCETSPKKSSLLKNVGLFLAGVAVGSSAMFYIKNTNNNNY